VRIHSPVERRDRRQQQIFVGVKGGGQRAVTLYEGEACQAQATAARMGVQDFIGVELAPWLTRPARRD